MPASRLAFALDSGAVALPASGRLAVLNPAGDADLSALPQDRLVLAQPFRPDHDALAARGLTVAADLAPGDYAAAVVFLPRARDHARALLAQAAVTVAPGGTVIVDGQKTDGIDAALRELRGLVAVGEPVAKAHGKVFAFPAGPALAAWADRPRAIQGGLVTRAGVFSADGPDRGSALLAAALPDRLRGRGVDLGAGWGYLSRAALAREGVTHLDVVEASATALDCARQNVTDPRAAFHWDDATQFRPARLADWVVCNPPFHTSRAADPGLGLAFIAAAARMLAPDGMLWLVSNRHLPYDRALAAAFREVEEVAPAGAAARDPAFRDPAFRLTRAARPVPPLSRR